MQILKTEDLADFTEKDPNEQNDQKNWLLEKKTIGSLQSLLFSVEWYQKNGIFVLRILPFLEDAQQNTPSVHYEHKEGRIK